MALDATARVVSLTGGGSAVQWKYGWALINAEAGASALQLQYASAEAGTYRNAVDGQGAAVATLGDATTTLIALLSPGVWVKATGTGTLNLLPQTAPTFTSTER